MKRSAILFVVGVAMIGLAMTNVAFKSPQDDATLTIVNKTDSDIDHIHFIFNGEDSGDVLDGGKFDILQPGQSETVEFNCSVIGNKPVTVKLIFEDGKSYTFEDDVCEGDFTWEIVDDGGHKN